MTPSTQQTAIYDWIQNGEGNLLIQARAGSGKSTTICHGTQFMKGKVLLLAFNKKAAVELSDKLIKMACPHSTASTFHAAGKGILYKNFGWHKVDASKVYWIVDSYCKTEELSYAKNFITKLVGLAKQSAFGVDGQTPIDDTEAWMKLITHYDISLDAEIGFDTAIEIAKKVLEESNRNTKVIDFDDMIYLPLIYNLEDKSYDWVLVDEAQDTNLGRKLLAPRLRKDDGRFIFVGDEKQAIYAFSGAEADSMRLIKEMFDCKELPLSVCYRCGSSIIEAAKKYCPDIEAYEGNGEGSISSMKYDEFINMASSIKLDGSVGILCRNNAPNVALAFALIRQGIGVRIEGRDIGNDLVKLVRKWKKVKTLEEFTIKLSEFFNKEFEKANYAKLALLEDKLDTMILLIERCQSLGQTDLKSLEDLISSMFSDTGDAKTSNLVTLSSIHKAKGLEWPTVYILGNEQFVPSKYAKQDWELESEDCLLYVSVTRAMNDLIHLTDCPTRRNKED